MNPNRRFLLMLSKFWMAFVATTAAVGCLNMYSNYQSELFELLDCVNGESAALLDAGRQIDSNLDKHIWKMCEDKVR
jgi:hypothetical protein